MLAGARPLATRLKCTLKPRITLQSTRALAMVRQSPRKRAALAGPAPAPSVTANGTKERATSTVGKAKETAKAAAPKIGKRKAAVKEEEDEEETKEVDPKPQPKKRKSTKKSKEPEPPLAARTPIDTLEKPMYMGAHVSSAGGVQNSVENARHIGANAFALFLKSQRKWDNPPLSAESRSGFRDQTELHSFDAARHCLPHGSYLVNLAQKEADKATQAYNAFLDDLKRCEQLGIKLYNFHPGNAGAESRKDAIGRIAAQLNKALEATETVIPVLENMAGQGNVIGSTWEDLRDIIALVDDKSRVGVCIDTCHAFAAGHDLRTPETFKETMSSFNDIVGNKYLKAFHLNDSKAPLGSNRDLHANIGTGFLGLRAFHSVMNCDDFTGLPMVLETPIDKKGPDGKSIEDKTVWAEEIKLLESLIGMDADGDEFRELEEKLQSKGSAERMRLQDQVDRKSAKDAKKGPKGKKGKKSKTDEDDEDEDEDEDQDPGFL